MWLQQRGVPSVCHSACHTRCGFGVMWAKSTPQYPILTHTHDIAQEIYSHFHWGNMQVGQNHNSKHMHVLIAVLMGKIMTSQESYPKHIGILTARLGQPSGRRPKCKGTAVEIQVENNPFKSRKQIIVTAYVLCVLCLIVHDLWPSSIIHKTIVPAGSIVFFSRFIHLQNPGLTLHSIISRNIGLNWPGWVVLPFPVFVFPSMETSTSQLFEKC